MIVEIRKTGFVNKGAELMLLAAIQQVRGRFPEAKLVMAPTHSGDSAPYEHRANLGFYQKAWLWRYGIQLGDLARLAPAKLLDMYGVVLDKDVDVVLDAAGFSYSDQWGVGFSQELARSARRWKKNGTKLILLPQAFGPYTSVKSKEAVKVFVENADLIYARDEVSYRHLTEIVGEVGNVRLSPDFTNIVEGTPASNTVCKNLNVSERVCLIPNYRMVDKTSQGSDYVSFMKRVVKVLRNYGEDPFILIHDRGPDINLADSLSAENQRVDIIEEQDALRIKEIIGGSKAVIGSRFHGLVSALSQGVPALATGWSHKYEMLFSDYGLSDSVLDVAVSEPELYRLIGDLLDHERHIKTSDQLRAKSTELKALTETMWREVHEVMRSS